MTQFLENARTDGRTDGRLDRPYFIGPIPATAEGPKSISLN